MTNWVLFRIRLSQNAGHPCQKYGGTADPSAHNVLPPQTPTSYMRTPCHSISEIIAPFNADGL